MPKAATDKPTSKKGAAAEKPKKAKKDTNQPKRGLSAYMFFVQDYRERMKAENPDASFGELGKLLGAKWKELSDGEKKPYESMAEKDKLRAAKDKAAYDAQGGSGASKPSKKSKAAPVEEEDDDEE